MYPKIESRDNQLVKQIVKLGSSKIYREEQGLSIIYGIHLLEEAQKYGVLKSLIIDEAKIHIYADIITGADNVAVYTTTAAIMKKLNLLDGQIDLVGVARFSSNPIPDTLYNESCLILENIQDPGNLGTIFRVAKASGVNNIILSAGSVDPYNPKVLRGSQGAVFGLNIYTGINTQEFVQNYNSRIIATSPYATKSLYTTDLTGPIAWVFGNEGAGLSDKMLDMIQEQLTIPMQNNTESLNIAMAVTVCLFEQLRQQLLLTGNNKI